MREHAVLMSGFAAILTIISTAFAFYGDLSNYIRGPELEKATTAKTDRRTVFVPRSGLIRPISSSVPRPRIALAVKAGTPDDRAAAARFAEKLLDRSKNVAVITDLFVPAFYSDGHLERILAGNLALLKASGAFKYVSRATFGKLTSNCLPKDPGLELFSCRVRLEYQTYDRRSRLIDSGRIVQVGPGLSRGRAILRGAEMLAEAHGRRVLNLPAGAEKKQ